MEVANALEIAYYRIQRRKTTWCNLIIPQYCGLHYKLWTYMVKGLSQWLSLCPGLFVSLLDRQEHWMNVRFTEWILEINWMYTGSKIKYVFY